MYAYSSKIVKRNCDTIPFYVRNFSQKFGTGHNLASLGRFSVQRVANILRRFLFRSIPPIRRRLLSFVPPLNPNEMFTIQASQAYK